MLALAPSRHRGVKPLLVGQTFETWRDLQNSIIEDGILKERIVETVYKDNGRYAGRCKMHGPGPTTCKWYLRAILSLKSEVITITKFHGIHTCNTSDHYGRRMHTRSGRLADHVVDILLQNNMTRACTLRDTLKAQVHPDVPYHAAHKAKAKAQVRISGDEKDSFHLIPAHLQHILERDPGATTRYRAPNGHFENLFVCPLTSNDIVSYCRPIVAFDGTHTRSKFPQMLLLASALDANHTIVLLAYGMAPSKNGTEWNWFLELLHEACPNLTVPHMMFQSDREKGLLDEVPGVFPSSHHVFCTWHLGENVCKHHGKLIQKMFEGLVFAVTPEQFHRRMEKIEERDTAAAHYIRTTADPQHYSRAFIPGIRWGKETSQAAESLNRHIKAQRSLVAFHQSCRLWDYMMSHHYEKKKLAEATLTPFPPNIMSQLKDVEESGVQLISLRSSDMEVKVTDEEGREFLVFLAPNWSCTCGDFQDKRLPCRHAWRAITHLKKVHNDYVDPLYSTEAFRATYSSSIPALRNQDFVPDPNCGPSLKRRKRGRPSEKSRLRFREEEGLRNDRRCGVCAKRGHDKRTCPVTKGARAAVAYKRALEAGSGDSGDSGDNAESDEEQENDENSCPNTQATEIDMSQPNYFSELLESVGSEARDKSGQWWNL